MNQFATAAAKFVFDREMSVGGCLAVLWRRSDRADHPTLMGFGSQSPVEHKWLYFWFRVVEVYRLWQMLAGGMLTLDAVANYLAICFVTMQVIYSVHELTSNRHEKLK